MSLTSLPPIDQAQLPQDIRTATPARKDAYEAGLGFERLLIQQLSQSLTNSARDALGGDSPYASLLPDALTDGVMGGGGLGLARQLADAIQPPATNADRAAAPPAQPVVGEDARAAAEGGRARTRRGTAGEAGGQDPPTTATEPMP